MVLPEASTVVNQNIEPNCNLAPVHHLHSNTAPNVVSNRFGSYQADAMPTNTGRLSIGSGRLAVPPELRAPGTASAQAPDEASPRGRSAEDEHRRWMQNSNEYLNDL